TTLAVVPKLHTRDVVRDGALSLGDLLHLICRHEQERRVLIDESTDQPGAGDAIDARSFASHPLHRDSPFTLSTSGVVQAPKTSRILSRPGHSTSQSRSTPPGVGP